MKTLSSLDFIEQMDEIWWEDPFSVIFEEE